MTPAESLLTPRLRLRPLAATDAEAIFAYMSNADVAHQLVRPPVTDIARTHDFIARAQAQWAEGTTFIYGITEAANDDVIGTIDARMRGSRIELGYVLSHLHWGKGYMSEAVKALRDWGLTQQGIFRIEAFCRCSNAASQRVLEKAEFIREARLRNWSMNPDQPGEPEDVFVYANLRQTSSVQSLMS